MHPIIIVAAGSTNSYTVQYIKTQFNKWNRLLFQVADHFILSKVEKYISKHEYQNIIS